MRTLLIALLLVLMLAAPAFAGFYHHLEVEVSGEYDLTTSFVAPDVMWNFDIAGVGEMKLNSIVAVVDYNANWWNLF